MQQNISLSPGDILRFIRRGLLPALLLAALLGTAAYFLSRTREPVYEAEANIAITLGDVSLGAFAPAVVAPALATNGYAIAAEREDLLANVLTALGTANPTPRAIEELRDRVTPLINEGSGSRESSFITIRVEGATPEGVATTANALARALIDWDRQRAEVYLDEYIAQLEANRDSTQEQVSALQAQGASAEEIGRLANRLIAMEDNLATAEASRGAAGSRLSVLQAAFPPIRPASPSPRRYTIIAAMLGFLLGYGALFVRNLFDTGLRSVEDLENVSGLPILGEFPKPAKRTRRLPREASGYLRTNLLLATPKEQTRVILVTSPGHGEGKSSVALSLAESFTRANYRTLLVDADLRKPVIASEYNLDDKRHMPLRTHLENPHGAYEAAHVGVNVAQTLDIIPTFRPAPSPTELLSLGFPACLESWRKDYDVIIIDSAPLKGVADTLTIAPLCTGTVLVASLEDTDPQEVADAVELLQRSGVHIFGIAATFVGASSRTVDYRTRDPLELLDEREVLTTRSGVGRRDGRTR